MSCWLTLSLVGIYSTEGWGTQVNRDDSAADGVKQAVWLRHFLHTVRKGTADATTLYMDNQLAMKLAENPTSSALVSFNQLNSFFSIEEPFCLLFFLPHPPVHLLRLITMAETNDERMLRYVNAIFAAVEGRALITLLMTRSKGDRYHKGLAE